MKKILQFGAGSIGRGFLGQLYTESGYEVVFLEALDEMVQQLNRDQQYRLKIVGTNARELTISPVRAVNVRDPDAVAEEFETATLLGTAVGARNLPGVASVIVAGMRHRADLGFDEPLDLVICENLPHAAHVMRGHLHHHSDADFQAYLDTHLGLVETVVTRMVPLVPPELAAQDPTVVLSEDFKRLPVNQTAFKGPWPEVEGMIFTDNLPAYHEQKLYTDNTCHALLAYQG